MSINQLAEREAGTIGRSYDLLIGFARHLRDDKGFLMDDIFDVLEKPWKWQREYEAWRDELRAEAARQEGSNG